MRVLLVKTSSMGDVVQTLPVLRDIRRHHPEAHIDWLVEASYADLVAQHPDVERVIPVAWRRWSRSPLAAATRREWRALRAALAVTRYDAIIDLQGLCKSAVLARLAQGTHFGWKGRACREPAAAALYDRRLAAPPYDSLLAVQRYRNLCAWALGYAPEGLPEYGLQTQAATPDWVPAAPGGFAVLLSATARDEKLWAESEWVELGRALLEQGMAVALAWGNEPERARAQRIAQGLGAGAGPNADRVRLAPRVLGLVDWARTFAAARIVVGVDTGLSFLAAAVGCPVIGIYTATSPEQVGIQTAGLHRNMGDVGQAPRAEEVVQAARDLLARSGAGA